MIIYVKSYNFSKLIQIMQSKAKSLYIVSLILIN